MAFRRNPALNWLAAILAIGFAHISGLLPLSVSRAIGAWLGRIAYHIVPRLRRVGMANMDLAYGDALTRREKTRILRESAANMGIVAAEFIHIPRLHGKFLEEQIELRGAEHLDRDRGALFIGAHYGNWEWMAPAIVALGCQPALVVRPMDHPRFHTFVDGVRRSHGVDTIPREKAGVDIIRRLREGWFVGMLVDQSPRVSAVPIEFFGQPCWGSVAPVMAAIRAGAAIHPASMERQPSGGYRLEILPAVELETDGPFVDCLVRNTQRCQKALEDIIRRDPSQWLWFHRRWRHREALARKWSKRKRQKHYAEEPMPVVTDASSKA